MGASLLFILDRGVEAFLLLPAGLSVTLFFFFNMLVLVLVLFCLLLGLSAPIGVP